MIAIRLKDIKAQTIIGVYEHERVHPQEILLNIELEAKCNKAAITDNLADTIDYAMLEEKIIGLLARSSFNLLEKLIKDVGDMLINTDNRITKVFVEAQKNGILPHSRAVSVCCTIFGNDFKN